MHKWFGGNDFTDRGGVDPDWLKQLGAVTKAKSLAEIATVTCTYGLDEGMNKKQRRYQVNQ